MSSSADDEDDFGPNPGFNRPVRRDPEADKAALRAYFKANGTPEAFYLSYPAERPPEPEPRPVTERQAATAPASPVMAEIAAMHAESARQDAGRTAPNRNMPELER